MSRRSKGPRLYLRTGRIDARSGKPIPDLFYIRDGSREVGTGCGLDRMSGAEQALAAYIAEKWTPPIRGGSGDPASILVAEVLALYARERAPDLADPAATAARVKALLAWWGDKTVADVKRSTCQAYVAHRKTQPIASARTDRAQKRKVSEQGARRELEDLSSAIGHWSGEHTLTSRPKVWLPVKSESNRDALTRNQAAALLKAARGYRWTEKTGWRRLAGSAPANRAHLVRFVLIAIYTGTRPGVIPRLLWEESPVSPWVSADDGIIYRRGRSEREHRTKRRPMVRLPHRLVAHMSRWRRLDEAWAAELRGKGIEAPTTVLHHGTNPLAGRIRRSFASAVADSGLPRGITPHWLRHTCATWLMEAGVPLWDAAAFTGMTSATLEKCYGHHRPDHQEKARSALG